MFQVGIYKTYALFNLLCQGVVGIAWFKTFLGVEIKGWPGQEMKEIDK